MSAVVVGKTTDRSVTGQMVDFAKHLTYCLPDNGWNEWDLHAAARPKTNWRKCRVARAGRSTK